MNLPDSTFWGGVGFVLAWLLKHEAQIMARPTRQEQEASAAKVAADVKCQFDEIKHMLEKQNEQTALHRELMGDAMAGIRESVTGIREKVAVLRDRTGDDPLGETGSHRRRP